MPRKYLATTRSTPWHNWDRSYKTKVYDAVKASGDAGLDRKEVASATGLNVGRVSTYLAELKRMGLVKSAGEPQDITTLSPKDAKLFAMNALENALVTQARETGITFEMEKSFATYNKVKALALGALTPGEETAAMRQALLGLVRLVF
jgi:Winged helix-turn-helix DNA-binding